MLNLRGNAVDPLPIILSLELIEEGQFKVRVHTGAPFNMVLPIRVANGTIVGGENSIEISTGSVISDTLTVSRTPGTTAAVTVDIGELPSLPPDNYGYALVKSADLPLEAIAVVNVAPIITSEATFTVEENITTVCTVTASDADSGDDITAYAITGGVDQAKFSIGATTGVLSFKVAPDFENPSDVASTIPANAASNNEYIVVVTATGGTGDRALTARDTLTITVTDVDEPPSSPPSNVQIVHGDGQFTVSWDAVQDEAGKSPVIGYEIERRIGDPAHGSNYQYTRFVSGRTNTSVTYTGLTNGQRYKPRIRTVNDEGASVWKYLPPFYLYDESTGKWIDYVQARIRNGSPWRSFADFSSAGYHHFNDPVPSSQDIQHLTFAVTDYGAVADDDQSDQAAIKAAIAAAEQNNGGVVFFPPGEFLVNTDADNGGIRIRKSNIILRGSGSRNGGTVIRQVNHRPPRNPSQLWSTPVMFWIAPPDNASTIITSVTENSLYGTFWLTVADASNLHTGQWIELSMQSTAAINDFFKGKYRTYPQWQDINAGIAMKEKHTIAEIQGNRIRLNEPLHMPVKGSYGVEVRTYSPLQEVGIEDISFHGSWGGDFIHHRDAFHDGGWSMVQFTRCVNSWVRRVSFINVNQALSANHCAAMSIYHVTMDGYQGHFSIALNWSTSIWVGLVEDLAGHHHGPSLSKRAAGNVFWRYELQRNRSFDGHGEQPYSNLFDLLTGGIRESNSGSHPPHHRERLICWNLNYQSSLTNIDFWIPGRIYGSIINPVFVGLHGGPVTLHDAVVQLQGQQVYPRSLFEAQLEFRTQAIPDWLNNLRTDWTTLRGQALPSTAPAIIDTIANQNLRLADSPVTMDLGNYFRDLDGDNLTYTATSSNTGIATVSVSGSVVTVSLHQAGNTTITVRADDGNGPASLTTLKFNVMVPRGMYWVDHGKEKIYRADPDGSNVEGLITTGLDGPWAMALDVTGGKMYWVDRDADKIQCADLNGSNVEDLITTGLNNPVGIALDITGGKMYWTDIGADKIQRADLDGFNVEDLITTQDGLDNPLGIAIEGGKVYWTDRGTNKIQRADLDGSNIEDLITTGLNDPGSIAIGGGKVYWTDFGADKIQRADLDGSNVEDLITTQDGLDNPVGIALDITGGKMYWVDNSTDKIQRADLDGSNIEDLITTGLNNPRDLVLDFGSDSTSN